MPLLSWLWRRQISAVFRRAQKNKSTENRVTRRMALVKIDLKSAKSTDFDRMVPPKEWDFSCCQLYRFQRCLREYTLDLLIGAVTLSFAPMSSESQYSGMLPSRSVFIDRTNSAIVVYTFFRSHDFPLEETFFHKSSELRIIQSMKWATVTTVKR